MKLSRMSPLSLQATALLAFMLSTLMSTGTPRARAADPIAEHPLVGRWDLSVEGVDGPYPSWLEVKLSGYSTLVGSYVGQLGSARPISRVDYDPANQAMHFAVPPQWELRSDDVVIAGRLQDGRLSGTTTDELGRTLQWTGQRAPSLAQAENDLPYESLRWGEPVELFNGRDLAGWQPMLSQVANGWVAKDGVLINQTPGNNLATQEKFDDFQLHAEFRYPENSNGGIYLRGRYEVQIADNFGEEPNSLKIGGVYGFLTPSRNVARQANEWQTYDITLVGRTVTVEFNGERIIDRQVIPGITGGAIDSDEGSLGPIFLQGDHGPVEFRKLTLTPLLPSTIAGDFNSNGLLDVADINMLEVKVAGGANPEAYDLNQDSKVDTGDLGVWVRDLKKTWIGDADLNGQFNSEDFVRVFEAGKYNWTVAADWSQGDWNGDLRFNSSDLVSAFADGGFEAGLRTAVAAVPEPSSAALGLLAVGSLAFARPHRWKPHR
jgi:hypothetical protein